MTGDIEKVDFRDSEMPPADDAPKETDHSSSNSDNSGEPSLAVQELVKNLVEVCISVKLRITGRNAQLGIQDSLHWHISNYSNKFKNC